MYFIYMYFCSRFSDTEKLIKKHVEADNASASNDVVEELETIEFVNVQGTNGKASVIERIETVVQEVVEVEVEGLGSLEQWLTEVERELSSSSLPTRGPELHKMQRNYRGYSSRVTAELERLYGYQREMTDRMESSSRRTDVIVTGNLPEVISQLARVIERCNTLQQLLESRLIGLGEQLEIVEHHHEEIKGLQTWLAEVKVFLKAEEEQVEGPADIDILKAQLQQSNALQGDIDTLSCNLSSVERTSALLNTHDQAAALRMDWDPLVLKAKQLNVKLEEALNKKQHLVHVCNDMTTWINGAAVPVCRGIETSGDLTTAIEQCKLLQQQLQVKTTQLKPFAQTVEAAPVWEKLTSLGMKINEGLDNLHLTLRNYNSFKELSSGESRWLSDLEVKLQCWSQSAADAEEISAKLDELESFLRSGNEREEQLNAVAGSLLDQFVMTVAVQNSQHNTSTRRKQLIAKSETVQRNLEAASVTAQECEQRYLTLMDRLSALQHAQLQQYTQQQVHDDVTAASTGLDGLRHQVQLYQSEGNQPAADRVAQQLHLLQTKFDEIIATLNTEGLIDQSTTTIDVSSSIIRLELSSPLAQRSATNLLSRDCDASKTSPGNGLGDKESPAASKRLSVELSERVEEMRARLHVVGERAAALTITSADPAHVQGQLTLCLV